MVRIAVLTTEGKPIRFSAGRVCSKGGQLISGHIVHDIDRILSGDQPVWDITLICESIK